MFKLRAMKPTSLFWKYYNDCKLFQACPLNTYKKDETTCERCPLNSHTDVVAQMKTGCICDEGFTSPAGGPCQGNTQEKQWNFVMTELTEMYKSVEL